MKFYAHSDKNKDKCEWHLLKTHLHDTAAKAGAMAKVFNAEKLSSLAGILHDVGKYSHEFQKRLAGQKIKVDHSTAGALEAIRINAAYGKLLAYVISGHHCGLPDWGSEADEVSLAARQKRKVFDYRAFLNELELPFSGDVSFPPLKRKSLNSLIILQVPSLFSEMEGCILE